MSRKTAARRTTAAADAQARQGYEPPRILSCQRIESLAVVCDSARAPSGTCRVGSLPTCVTLYS